MVVILNSYLLSLETILNDRPAIFLLDSDKFYNFPSLDWYQVHGLKYNPNKHFGVCLENRQEVPAVAKVKCFVDLGPIKTAFIIYMLHCNIPCILGILFL